MKKLLFSTMAVLAFSVSGMANTVENSISTPKEQMVIVTVKLSATEPSEFDRGYCTATADITERLSKTGKFTYEQWKAVYDKCIEDRKTLNAD
jgi:hypothetical protein